MNHAYLVVGGDSAERREKCLQLAKDFLKKDPWQSPDFTFVTPVTSSTQIGIGEIRELQKKLSLKAYQKGKAAYLSPAENLTAEAQNALLKTLEEPSEQTLIFLDAANPDSLLPTIVSRCQVITLSSKAQLSLTQEEKREIFKIFLGFYRAGVGKRLLLLAKYPTKKEEVELFFKKQTVMLGDLLRQVVEGKYQKITAEEILTVLKSLQFYQKLLAANTNPKLVLDNFILDLLASE